MNPPRRCLALLLAATACALPAGAGQAQRVAGGSYVLQGALGYAGPAVSGGSYRLLSGALPPAPSTASFLLRDGFEGATR
jgi:hypothetical protein